MKTQASFQQYYITSNFVTYATHKKSKGRDLPKVQRLSCKDYGRIAAHCPRSGAITARCRDILSKTVQLIYIIVKLMSIKQDLVLALLPLQVVIHRFLCLKWS